MHANPIVDTDLLHENLDLYAYAATSLHHCHLCNAVNKRYKNFHYLAHSEQYVRTSRVADDSEVFCHGPWGSSQGYNVNLAHKINAHYECICGMRKFVVVCHDIRRQRS
jgi:hypothetical protein